MFRRLGYRCLGRPNLQLCNSGVIRNEHRGKVVGIVQSAWSIGWAVAALVATGLFQFLPPEYKAAEACTPINLRRACNVRHRFKTRARAGFHMSHIAEV
jgi:hypothetical protein